MQMINFLFFRPITFEIKYTELTSRKILWIDSSNFKEALRC